MQTYGQFCPVAKAAEIFAERWTPLIIRELLMGSKKFGELEIGMAHIPRSLLTQHLRSFEDAGVLTRKIEGDNKQAECLDDGRIELDGLTAHVDAFPRWLKLSDFAGVKPAGISA